MGVRGVGVGSIVSISLSSLEVSGVSRSIVRVGERCPLYVSFQLHIITIRKEMEGGGDRNSEKKRKGYIIP